MACGDLPFEYVEKIGKEGQFPTIEELDLLEGTFSAQRVFEGPWADRFEFVFNYLLKPIILGGTNITIFAIPNQYPEATIAFAKKVSISGKGKALLGTSGLAAWDRAEITVTYEIPTFNIDSGNNNEPSKFVNRIFIDESFESNVEFLSKDASKIKIEGAADNLGEEVPMNFLTVLGTFTLTQEYIILPRWYEIDNAYGKVNDRPFILPSGFTCPAETLRYDGKDGGTKVNIWTGAGENFPLPVFRLGHKFSFNKHGWNTKHLEGKFQKVVFADNNEPFYKTADLYTIFFGFGNPSFDTGILDQIQTKFDDLNANLDGGGTIEDAVSQGILQDITNLRKSLGFRT